MHLRRLVAVAATFVLLAGLAPAALAATAPADTTPPALDLIVPKLTNATTFPVAGHTEPGATVLVNGKPVTPKADGSFSALGTVTDKADITVTATDAAGNKAERTATVTYTKAVPSVAAGPVVGITGTVEPGTVVTNLLDSTWAASKANAAGLFRIFWDDLKLGGNDLFLQFAPPAGAPYYEYYRVAVPYELLLPRRTNENGVTYKGRTFPGWNVTLNDQPVTAAADGTFEITPDLKPGVNSLTLAVKDPKSTGYASHVFSVELVNPPMPVVTNGTWDWLLSGWAPGTVFVRLGTGGKDLLDMPDGGKAAWRMPMHKGTNNFDFLILTPKAETYVFHFRYDYTPAPLQVHMNLGKSKAQAGGKELDVPVPPQRIDDLTYVPLRFLGDSLGATVTWDDATQTATFVLGDKTVKVTLDSVDATVNGEHKAMVAPARLVNDRTLVPLRFISENLGAKVDWDEATEGITITLP